MPLKPQTKFARWLHNIRESHESERAFAHRLGISHPTLRRIYEGKQVDNSTLEKIAKSSAHNLGIDEIFRLAGALPPEQRRLTADRELGRIITDLESLKGTPVYDPVLRAVRMVIDVAFSKMDAPE